MASEATSNDAIVSTASTELARIVDQPWDNWERKKKFAADLVVTGFCPVAVKTPAQAMAIILAGQELGMGPLHSLRSINVINGKVGLSAELMMAKMLASGAILFEWLEDSEVRAVLRATRRTMQYTGSFTLDEATRAGLMSKDGWKKYPKAMLRARAIALVARVVAPDMIAGLYTPEELGADVDAEGKIVSLPVGAVIDAQGPSLGPLPACVVGSPFEFETWTTALTAAETPALVEAVWDALTKTFRGTFLGFSPPKQAELAARYAAAREAVRRED